MSAHLIERWHEWGVWRRSGGMNYSVSQTNDQTERAARPSNQHSDPTLTRAMQLENMQAHRVLLADQTYAGLTAAVKQLVWKRHVELKSIEAICIEMKLTDAAYKGRYNRALRALRLEVVGRALSRRLARERDERQSAGHEDMDRRHPDAALRERRRSTVCG